MASSPNKRMVVMLDTSDIINLNHLDIIPLLTLNTLDQIVVNVDIEKRHPNPCSADPLTNQYCTNPEDDLTLSSHEELEKDGSVWKINPYTKQRVKQSRVDGTEDSSKRRQSGKRSSQLTSTKSQIKNCSESQCKLSRMNSGKTRKLKRRRRVNLTEILDTSTTTEGQDDDLKENEGEEAEDWFIPPEVCDEIVKQIHRLGIQDDLETSTALQKLSEALKDLESSWIDEEPTATTSSTSPQVNKLENYKPPSHLRTSEDVLTLVSQKIEPFTCHSSNCSSSVIPDSRLRTQFTHRKFPVICNKMNSILPNRFLQPLSQSDALISFTKDTPGDYFRSITPSQGLNSEVRLTGEGGQEGQMSQSPAPALSTQKTADIWNWVSPKYTVNFHKNQHQASTNHHKIPGFFPGSDAGTFNNFCQKQWSKCSVRNGSQIDRDENSHQKDQLDEFVGEFLKHTAKDGATVAIAGEEGQGIITPPLTRPCTSAWNLSPLYESSQCIPLSRTSQDDPLRRFGSSDAKEVVSESSLTPFVFSLASLADVNSGDDIATRCSTASTVTEFEYHPHMESRIDSSRSGGVSASAYRKCVENLTGISNEKLLKILGEFNKKQEEKRNIQSAATATPPPTTVDPSYGQSSQFLPTNKFPSSIDIPSKESGSKIRVKSTVSKVKTKKGDPSSPVRIKSSTVIRKYSTLDMKKSKKKKDKKKMKKKKLKEEDEISTVDEEEKNKENKKAKKKAITLFSHFKKRKLELEQQQTQDGVELPLQKLKNSLPRTVDGRFAFSTKEAEVAIADYVRAELAATLKIAEAKLKPGKLRDVLCSVSTDQNVGKCSNSNNVCRDKLLQKSPQGVTQGQTSPVPRKPIPLSPSHNSGMQRNIPFTSMNPRRPVVPNLTKVRPCGVIPKQSNRMNFIRYQQQSIAAMLNISRAKMNKTNGYFKQGFGRPQQPPMTMTHTIAREFLELVKKKEAALLQTRNQIQQQHQPIRSNRNAVTVVFENNE